MEISLSDLEEMEKTRGWIYNLMPYWKVQINKMDLDWRNLVKKSKDLSEIKYEQGYLEGYKSASRAIESIRLGHKLTLSRLK